MNENFSKNEIFFDISKDYKMNNAEKAEWNNRFKTDETMFTNIKRSELITKYLVELGYKPISNLDIIHIVEENNIDISKFELPNNFKSLSDWKEYEEKQKDKRNKLIQKSHEIKDVKIIY